MRTRDPWRAQRRRHWRRLEGSARHGIRDNAGGGGPRGAWQGGGWGNSRPSCTPRRTGSRPPPPRNVHAAVQRKHWQPLGTALMRHSTGAYPWRRSGPGAQPWGPAQQRLPRCPGRRRSPQTRAPAAHAAPTPTHARAPQTQLTRAQLGLHCNAGSGAPGDSARTLGAWALMAASTAPTSAPTISCTCAAPQHQPRHNTPFTGTETAGGGKAGTLPGRRAPPPCVRPPGSGTWGSLARHWRPRGLDCHPRQPALGGRAPC